MKKVLAIACSVGLWACSGETGEPIDSTSRSLVSDEIEYAFAVRDVDKGQPGGDKGKEFVIDRIASDGTVQTEVIGRTTEGGARVLDLVPGGTEIRGFKTLPGLTAGILAGEVTSIDEETELVEEAFRFNAGLFGVEKTGQSQDLGFPGDEGEASAKSLNPDELLFIDIGPMLGIIVDEGEDCRVGLRLFTDVVDGATVFTSAALDLKATSRDDDGVCDGAALVLSSGSIMVDDVIEFSGDGSGVEISLEAVCPCWESLDALQAKWLGFEIERCVFGECKDVRKPSVYGDPFESTSASCTALDGQRFITNVFQNTGPFWSCLNRLGDAGFEQVVLTRAEYEICSPIHDAFTATTVFNEVEVEAVIPDNIDRRCLLPNPLGLCAGTECDDSNECTIDSCDPAVGCTYEALGCDDANACTTDSCDPAIGCANEILNCDDANACTTDSCDSGSGCINEPVACDDGNACTAESCDPDVGCTSDPAIVECPDAPPCFENVLAECDPELGCPTQPLTSDGVCATACDFQGTGDLAGFQSECLRICGPSGFICSQDPNGTLASCLAGDPVACESVDETGASFGCNVCPSTPPECLVEVCDATGCTTVPDDSLCVDDGVTCTIETCDPILGCVSTPDDSLCATGETCRLFEGCVIPPTCPCWDGAPNPTVGQWPNSLEEYYSGADCSLFDRCENTNEFSSALCLPGTVSGRETSASTTSCRVRFRSDLSIQISLANSPDLAAACLADHRAFTAGKNTGSTGCGLPNP